MKKTLILLILSILCLFGCKKDEETNNQSEVGDIVGANCNIYATEYDDINQVKDIDGYQSGVATNLPVKDGVIVSPYYTLTINGEDIPVYATRTTNTIHSFAYIDVELIDKSKGFNLNIVLDISAKSSVLSKKNPSVVVLPQKHGVEAILNERQVTTTITNYGSYSFAFNKKQDEALTLFVAEKENKKALFGEKEVVYINPGDYSTDEKMATFFEEKNRVYYFKAGRYLIDRVIVPADCIIYLEQGAYLEIIPTTEASAFQSAGEQNITIAGRGLVDFSACCGGEVPDGYHSNKGGLVFSNVTNMIFSGVTVINSQTWTLCLNNCIEAKVFNCLFFGYRVYSDGIMLSDCKNAVVEKNFIRTGDDAFETKSTTSNGLTENVWFKNNDAWTDKGVAYGCIYESNHDTSDVHFEDCTVGFAMGSWSNHLGCCVIQMGNRKGAKMYDISFDNIEIYASYNAAILNIFIGGSGGRGEGYGHVDNIHFSNIIARRNYGAFLNLRTCDAENCSIKRIYVDNIMSNDILLTKQNYTTDGYVTDNVIGGYNFNYLQINTKTDE